MTLNEYRDRLASLNETEFATYRREYGGDGTTREWYVRDYVDHPHEARACQLLGLKTESEKQVEAALISAQAAVKSADAAQEANRHSRTATVISALAIVVSLASLAWQALTTFAASGR